MKMIQPPAVFLIYFELVMLSPFSAIRFALIRWHLYIYV